MKMLFSYKIFTFSQPFFQLLNKFYNKKFQNIHLTQPNIKIKTFLFTNSVRGGRKSERLREREIDWERDGDWINEIGLQWRR